MDRIEKIVLWTFPLALFGLASSQVHSFDIFWQLQSGRHILETREFLYQDTFSLASEAFRFEHCWLHDILFFGAYKLLGYGGVSLLKGFLVGATSFVLFLVARTRNSSWLSIALFSPAPILMTFWAWKARPQLWTFLCFALCLLILEKHRLSASRCLFLLLPLVIVWSNLHAGSILIFPLLLVYLAGAVLTFLFNRAEFRLGSFKLLVLVGCLLPLAILITPYGAMTLKTLVAAPSWGSASADILHLYNIDWLPTSFNGYPNYFYTMGCALLLMLIGARRLSFSDVFLLGGLAYMGFSLERHTPFFIFAVAACLPAYGDQVLATLVTPIVPFKVRSLLRLPSLGAAIFVTVLFAQPTYGDYGFFNLGLRQWHYPVQEAAFVKDHKLPGNIFNSYGVGGYLMWSLFPEYKVFWDGRQGSEEMFRLGLLVRAGRPGWQHVLDRFGVNTVITEACSQADGGRFPLVSQLQQSPRWSLVSAGESCMVFVRNSAVSSAWLKENRLPDQRLDDTILSAATLISQTSPLRRRAFWEIARVHLKRRAYNEAAESLKTYLTVTPRAQWAPEAEAYYRLLALHGNQRATKSH